MSPRPAPLLAGQRGEVAADFAVGTDVEVRDRFRGTWSHGFQIAGVSDGDYTVRRCSDRYILPATFAADRVRRNR